MDMPNTSTEKHYPTLKHFYDWAKQGVKNLPSHFAHKMRPGVIKKPQETHHDTRYPF